MACDLETALVFPNYAEELRLIAADRATPENRDALMKIALDYDKAAELLEAIARSKKALGLRHDNSTETVPPRGLGK
jgi:hypothetical protein